MPRRCSRCRSTKATATMHSGSPASCRPAGSKRCTARISTADSVRALLASRALLVKIKRDLENYVRGLLKNIGLVIGRAKFNVFAVRAERTGNRRQCPTDTGGGSAVLAGDARDQLTAQHRRRQRIGWREGDQIGSPDQVQIQADVYVGGNSAGQDLSRRSSAPGRGDAGMVIVHTECPAWGLLHGSEAGKLTRKPE